MSVIDEIKSRLDIVEYVGRFVPLKRAGRTYKACCPFHSEKTPSFHIDPVKQTWRCFGSCAEGGDLFSFAMKQHSWTFQEALEELAKIAGVELKPQTPEQRARDEAQDRLRGMLKLTAEYFHERLFDLRDANAVETLNYARHKRGLSDDTLRQFQIGYAPAGWRVTMDALTALGYSEDDLLNAGVVSRNDNGKVYDKFRHRLMIPIRDERGRTIGFGARALNPDDNPKYLNSPQTLVFDKSHTLFALDLAAKSIRDTETAVIVEGYLDAIQAHQAGYTNVVAQMGTALTEAQLKLIAPKWAKKIVMALDSDAAGQNATRRSLEVAREALTKDYAGRLSVEFRVITVPGAKDPDDLIRENPSEWGELVETAVPVADYVIGVETGELSPNATVQEREAAARRLLPILAASENDLYRKDNLQKLAMRLHIAERDLLTWAAEQQKIERAKAPSRDSSRRESASPRPSTSGAAFDEQTYSPDNPYADVPNFDAPIPAPPAQPISGDQARRRAHEAATLERYCLRILYKEPGLISAVNRKFREIAGDNVNVSDANALMEGPLGELCADDFNRSNTRALMLVLLNGMAQEELEVYDYVQRNIDSALLEELYELLADEWDALRPRLGFGLSVDLPIILMQSQRTNGAVNAHAEIIHHAMRLRLQRLERAMQEIAFLQMEGEHLDSYDALLDMIYKARRRIEMELRGGQAGSRNTYGKKA
jgi:DNA primase